MKCIIEFEMSDQDFREAPKDVLDTLGIELSKVCQCRHAVLAVVDPATDYTIGSCCISESEVTL